MSLDIFFDQFAQLADAPNGIKKLRELILQLVVQGKLVPQDPNDEPASVLLEKIHAEKARGNGPKRLLDDDVPELDAPYELPEGWVWVRFGDVTISRDSERIPLEKSVRANRQGPYDYYGASGVIDKIDDFLFDKPLLLIGEDGANLINRSTPIAFIAQGRYWVNNHAHVLDSISLDCLKYLEVHINAINLKPYITGTAQPKMNQAKMNAISIALPPLAEQRRIVAKVDQLMALCDELEARQNERREMRVKLNDSALGHLLAAQNTADFSGHWQRLHTSFDLLYDTPETIGKLRQAILQLAVQGKLVPQDPNDEPASVLLEKIRAEKVRLIEEGKLKKEKSLAPLVEGEQPFELPSGWIWTRQQDVFHVITDGDHQPPPKTDTGVPFLVISNVSKGALDFTNTRFVTEEYFASLDWSRVPRQGDILYTVTGSYGIPVEVTSEQEFCVQRHIAILKPSKLLSVRYLIYVLKSKVIFDQATRCATGIAQKTVPLSGLREMIIPLPSLAEQRRIVAKVDQLMALCDELEAKLKDAQAMSERLVEAVVRQVLAGGVTA